MKRAQKIALENRVAYDTGLTNIKTQMSKYALLIIGAALYWGEGAKKMAESRVSLSFVNSDPEMIRIFMRFLREVIRVPEIKIRGGIHLYKNIDHTKARNFWAKITALPSDRFYIVNQVSRASKGKRGTTLPFGTLTLKVNNRKPYYIVKGMIDGLINSSNTKHEQVEI